MEIYCNFLFFRVKNFIEIFSFFLINLFKLVYKILRVIMLFLNENYFVDFFFYFWFLYVFYGILYNVEYI